MCSASAHRRHREEGLYPARAGGGSRPPRGLGHQDRYPGSSGPRGRWAWGSWSPSAPDVPFGAMSCLSSLCGQVGQVSYKPAPPAGRRHSWLCLQHTWGIVFQGERPPYPPDTGVSPAKNESCASDTGLIQFDHFLAGRRRANNVFSVSLSLSVVETRSVAPSLELLRELNQMHGTKRPVQCSPLVIPLRVIPLHLCVAAEAGRLGRGSHGCGSGLRMHPRTAQAESARGRRVVCSCVHAGGERGRGKSLVQYQQEFVHPFRLPGLTWAAWGSSCG